jgi:hypothetical protein
MSYGTENRLFYIVLRNTPKHVYSRLQEERKVNLCHDPLDLCHYLPFKGQC